MDHAKPHRKNKNSCQPRNPLHQVGEKDNSFLVEQALNQKVMCVTAIC